MKKKDKNYHIVSFSGGKDSTAMLLLMFENGYHIDEVVFLDTGMEFPEMYEHINKVEQYIGFPITRLKSDKNFEYFMLEHKKTKKDGTIEIGYSFPDFRNRWCTYNLKMQVMRHHLKPIRKKYNIIEYHGIALDESERAKEQSGKKVYYPLIDYRMTEADALKYCYERGFDWGGLYEKFTRVSCWCCPLKGLKDLKTLRDDYPDMWAKLEEWQSKTYRKFRPDYSIFDLNEKFDKEESR